VTTTATIDTRTVTVTTGPFTPYTQTVAYERRLSDDLVISRSTTITWAGYGHSLMYLPIEDEPTRPDGWLGRYVGFMGYQDSDWISSDDAASVALQVAHDEWATRVAPFTDRKEPRT
jgi:hypothetical protein